jgi:ADP-ribose pyrophosphatase
MIRPWKKISQKEILRHARLTVFEDIVELPDGTNTDYLHFGKSLDGVTVIAIREDSKILVQKEYSYPPDEVLYQFPGGSMDEGEDAKAAADRELSEEANLAGELVCIGSHLIDNRRRQDYMHVFVARNLVDRPGVADIEEAFESYWLDAEEIDSLIAKGIIRNHTLLAAWAIYKATLTASRI